jgi:hypothetical protein
LLEKAQDETLLRRLTLSEWCELLAEDEPPADVPTMSEGDGGAIPQVGEDSAAVPVSPENVEPEEAAEPAGNVVTGEPDKPEVARAEVVAPRTLLPGVRLSLRNGTVGRSYRIEPGVLASRIAEACGDSPEMARVLDVEWPPDLGLVFDVESGAIEGIPLRPYEGELKLTYASAPEADPRWLAAGLLINPDPATLWKELDPPAGAPYARPSTEGKETRFGSYRVIAASRRGRSHANRGEFRDDAFVVGQAATTGWLVVVVADGAGSAKYSRRGAQLACEAVKARLTAAFNQTGPGSVDELWQQPDAAQSPEARTVLRRTLYEAALHAHYALQEEVKQPAEALPEAPVLRNFDTTLLILVMKPHEGGQLAATFAIGDGGVGVLTSPQEGHPLTRPEGGEHAGQTTFLTLPATLRNDEASLERRFCLEWLPSVTAAVAMTDGITDPKFPSDDAFCDPTAWASLWQELQPALESPEALLEWMNFFSPGNHDDRTLVAVLPDDSTPDSEPS